MTPGKKTSELWLILSVGVMAIANGTDFINVPWDVVTWYAGLAGVYTGGRSVVKMADKKDAV